MLLSKSEKHSLPSPSPPLPSTPPATLLLEITFLVVLEIGARNQAIGKGKEPFWHKDTNKLVRFLRLRLRFDILRVPCWYGGWVGPLPNRKPFPCIQWIMDLPERFWETVLAEPSRGDGRSSYKMLLKSAC